MAARASAASPPPMHPVWPVVRAGPLGSVPVVDHPPPERLALVVHPTRPIDAALATVARWSEAHGIPVVQPRGIGGWDRQGAAGRGVAPGGLSRARGGG